MEMNATAAYSNPFKILGEQYLSLHMGQIKKPEKNLVSQRKSINSLNWAALKIEDVPTEMKAFLKQTGILQDSANYHLMIEGKLFRAQLALAAAHLHDLDEQTALQLACVTEFIHNASLVHDDIQDQDETRRKRATVWKHYGANNALLLGDLLLSKAYEMLGILGMQHYRGPRLIGLLGEKIALLIQGQSDELEHQSDLTLPLQTYERIALCKTGALLSFPVEAALILSGVQESECGRVSRIFGRFGVAYQIHDDIIDLCASNKGRDLPGSDLREGRVSAVILQFWQQSSPEVRGQFENFFKDEQCRRDPEQLAYWVNALVHTQVLEASFRYLIKTLANCRQEAAGLPDPLNSFMLLVISQLEQRFQPEIEMLA
jgi:geranylgeranyl pyrophosphate synthase